MMTKRRTWYGLGVGMVAAVALLSGCSSKDRRLAPVSGSNGLLGSREIIPAPMFHEIADIADDHLYDRTA